MQKIISLRHTAVAIGISLCALVGAGAASAQTYPTKSIRMIIPFAPAGSSDVLGRIVAQKLGDRLGQPVVVENKGGADGVIGMDAFAKSPADGYTILFCTTSTYSINPSLYANKLPYNPDTAFSEVILAAAAPNILVATNALAAKNIKDMIALSKSKPGGLNAASAASMHTLNLKLFESSTGAPFTIISYKGTGPALNDLVGGQVDIMVDQITTSLPYVQAGRLHAIAVTSSKRFPALPDVPTVSEAVPGFETTSWWGVLAPRGTPAPIIVRLNQELNKVLADPTVIAKIESIGGQVRGGTPQQFAEVARADREKWAKVVKRYNLTIN
jgi:tripartite-type tricarboxylate transporter receptor subunit TctC